MNFSVKCTKNDILNGSRYFTVGKVYPVVNGGLMCDDGTEYNVSNFETANEINNYFKNFDKDITFSLA